MEKEMDVLTPNDFYTSDTDSDDSGDSETSSQVEHGCKMSQQENDVKFKELYERICEHVKDSTTPGNESLLDNLIQRLSNDSGKINRTRDQYDRTVFHYAVEMKNYALVKVFLAVATQMQRKDVEQRL